MKVGCWTRRGLRRARSIALAECMAMSETAAALCANAVSVLVSKPSGSD